MFEFFRTFHKISSAFEFFCIENMLNRDTNVSNRSMIFFLNRYTPNVCVYICNMLMMIHFRDLIQPYLLCCTRRGMVIPQTGAVVEAAPVPDLLGSILSGQSILLMDSSDVVINRDGSLKAAKPSKCAHIFLKGVLRDSFMSAPCVLINISVNISLKKAFLESTAGNFQFIL